MTQFSKKSATPEVTISATRVGKIALIAAISNEKEEESIKQVVDGLDDIKLAVTFVSGKTNKVKDTFIQSLIGCALQNKIIAKKAGHVHATIHAGLEALSGLSSSVPVDASLKIKVAIARDREWVAVAIYGESAFYPTTNHERSCMGVMHL